MSFLFVRLEDREVSCWKARLVSVDRAKWAIDGNLGLGIRRIRCCVDMELLHLGLCTFWRVCFGGARGTSLKCAQSSRVDDVLCG